MNKQTHLTYKQHVACAILLNLSYEATLRLNSTPYSVYPSPKSCTIPPVYDDRKMVVARYDLSAVFDNEAVKNLVQGKNPYSPGRFEGLWKLTEAEFPVIDKKRLDHFGKVKTGPHGKKLGLSPQEHIRAGALIHRLLMVYATINEEVCPYYQHLIHDNVVNDIASRITRLYRFRKAMMVLLRREHNLTLNEVETIYKVNAPVFPTAMESVFIDLQQFDDFIADRLGTKVFSV